MKISINAEANMSTISDLLFSGPYNINKTTLGAGQYILSWTPSENQTGESHPICFVVQAVLNTVKYQSELRCVIVNVGYNSTTTPAPTTPVTTPTITTTQTTTTISLTTTPLTTTTTAPTTTTIPSTTTPLTTTTTTPATTTTQTTTTLPSTTTPLTTTTTTPATTTTQTTNTILSTTTRTSGTTIWNPIVRSLRIKISFMSSLSEDDIRKNIIQLIRDKLPSAITLHLLSNEKLNSTTTATPACSP
ncbi:cell wall protein DAN4-like isoform X1 [Micropterus salmoides]|uniref:cell wall protein DAN4-like isoform X1 n=1 Tax=Micropterus salmoides TaxID=27706 RepID=UPI0018EAD306|nr:cell wall protein DAN4-like isoform X1 [Micropterus salmoides]